MKSWKKRWKEELDAVIPALSEEVKNAPIERAEHVQGVAFETPVPSEKPWYRQLISTPRRLASCLSACVVALVAVGASLYFALRPDASVTATAEVISVEVNPQAVFSVDADGKVTAVVAANADADVVLSESREAEMEGKTVEEAVTIFVDYTARLGYLDLRSQDAVRITSCTENSRLEEVGSTLESYFRGMGAYVAVARETVNVEEFCNRTGLALSSGGETLKESVERIPALFFQRESEGKTTEELQEMYRENVSLEEIKPTFEQQLKQNIARIEKNIEDLETIEALNDEIVYHADNPYKKLIFIGADYWTLQILNKQDEYTEEFASLMTEMEALLSAYESEYGVKLATKSDFEDAAEDCKELPLDVLYGLISDFTLELFSEYLSTLIDMLENIGIDMSWLSELYELPTNLQSYREKLQTYIDARYDNLYEENLGVYETERKTIGEEDYEAYLAGLIEEYGSLSAYFERN